MAHESANVLGRGLSRTSVVKRVYLVGQKANVNACQYFEIIEKNVDPVLHARVVVKSIAVKVVELRGVSL